MLANLIKTKIKINSIEFGQICFYIGTALLASTNFFAGIFYLISLVISLIKKNNIFKKDIYNYLLIICSTFLIISSINISTALNNSPVYTFLKEQSWNPSALWISLFNWIPLFLAFSGLQIYLNKESKRRNFAKCILVGLVPVIISIILQKFEIYGPFKYFNGLVVFYLKPIEALGGFAGLFSNPNYAGLWLSSSLPFCFLLLESYKYKKINLSLVFVLIIFTIYCILLTNSRNSLIGIIIASVLMISTKFLIFSILISGFIYFLISGLSTLPFLGSFGIQEFLPDTIFKKLLQTNYFSKFQFPRIDIWGRAINMIFERPFFGWGAATFPILYILRGGIENARHTHNMGLEIAQTSGIPAALILIFFVSYLFINSWKVIFIKNQRSESNINKAWISSLLIIIISHLSDLTYYDGRVSLLIWILLAGLKCILDEEKNKTKFNNLS
tara:strand:+ start:1011 stop:2342 length:1332 start_codon:yes stop_codon:yes gene_type:complete